MNKYFSLFLPTTLFNIHYKMDILNLNFMHPQYGTIFNADVDLSFTADEMLRNLTLSGFIPERAAGYTLALQNQVMQAQQPLVLLEALEEGAVLRIIPTIQNEAGEQSVAVEPLQFYVRHPRSSEYAPIECQPDTTGDKLLQQLLERGFLAELPDGLSLYFKEEALRLDESLKNLQLPEGAYIEIRDANTQSVDIILRNLLMGFDSLQAGTNTKLQAILEQMPPPSAIPIDPLRAINPTAKAYESMDTLLADIRRSGNLELLPKVRIWSPIPLILVLTLSVGIITLIVLSILQII